jgi:prolyl-tRNA synthetase
MYEFYEKELQNKGHLPTFFPTVIPEDNFKNESSHVEAFNLALLKA